MPSAKSGLRRPVFVVGAARSGTKLLTNLISSHPSIAMLPRETHFFNAFAPPYRKVDFRNSDEFERCWEAFTTSERFTRLEIEPEAVRRELESLGARDLRAMFTALLVAHARSQGKPMAGEKTPGHFKYVDTILNWYPDALVLFLVRDPRAVLTSRLNVGQPWASKQASSIVLNWRESVYEARRWAGSRNVRLIRYEQLVVNPGDELRETFDWMSLGYPEELLEREYADEPVSGAYHHAGRVETGSIDRWRETLKYDQVDYVERTVGAEMSWHSYELSQRSVSRLDDVAAEIRYLTHLAKGRSGRARSRVSGGE